MSILTLTLVVSSQVTKVYLFSAKPCGFNYCVTEELAQVLAGSQFYKSRNTRFKIYTIFVEKKFEKQDYRLYNSVRYKIV